MMNIQNYEEVHGYKVIKVWGRNRRKSKKISPM
jgi:hypothetical protein